MASEAGKGSERLHARQQISDEEMKSRWDNINYGTRDKSGDKFTVRINGKVVEHHPEEEIAWFLKEQAE